MTRRPPYHSLLAAAAIACVIGVGGAHASIFGSAKPAAPKLNDQDIAQIELAIDEQRLVDAARMLDQAALGGVKDPRLSLLDGRLDAMRGHFGDALTDYRMAEQNPKTHAQALEGAGIALAMLGRSDEALATLLKAVTETPDAWRAWNALGSEYDARNDWPKAEDAYQHAIAASGGAAIALNNRGYSRLLQHRRDEAVNDLVAALRKKPDLAEARTNLRLALALGGDYERAVAGAAPADQAALLNNAGFAAAMRGDYAGAEDLLNRAIKLKGEFYDRAAENLKVVQALAAQSQPAAPHATP